MADQQTLLINMHLNASKAIADVRRLTTAQNAQVTATQNATNAMRNFNTAAVGTNRSLRNMRGVAQQAGYQVADIAIVLQNGQNALQAFAIQGGQFLGAFGPTGAIIGALVTVGGILGSIFLDISTGTEQAADALKGLKDEVDKLQFGPSETEVAIMKEINDLIAQQTRAREFLRDRAEEQNKTLGEMIEKYGDHFTELQEQIDAQNEILDAIKERREFLEGEKEALEDISGTSEGLEAANKAIAELLEKRAEQAERELKAHQDMVIALTNQGRAMLSNIENNSDFFDPRTGGVEGPGARDPNYTRPDQGRNPLLDLYIESLDDRDRNNKGSKKGGGGGKGQTQAEIAAKAAAEAAKKAREEFELWRKETVLLDDLMEHGLTTGVNGFVDALFDAEASFQEFAATFLKEIGKMIAQQIILNALSSALTGGIPVGGATAKSIMMGFAASANGNVFSGGSLVPFAKGGVVSSPTLFPMTGGTGLMGEAGPEAIMPLSRGSDGRLGVSGPRISINNYGGAQVEVTRSDSEVVELAIDRVKNEFANSMRTGQGTFARSLEQGYTARRKAT